MYDVIIVGSGPSGSMSAYLLAIKGYKVILFEKAVLPRPKTCGGGLTYKAINQIPFDINPVIESTAMGGVIEFKGQPLVKVEAPDVANQVLRQSFDQFLAQKAATAGATILDGTSVTDIELTQNQVNISTTKGTFSSRFLIGADGVNSHVARKVGLLPHRQIGMAIEAEVTVPPGYMEKNGPYATFDFGAISHGYGWIFPKNGMVSIGVFHASPKKYPQLRRDFDLYLALHPEVPLENINNIRAHPIPLGGQKTNRHAGRVLLVGDAANLADPWMGEGIYYALNSAQMASDVILDCLNKGTANLEADSQRINQTMVRQFGYARLFASIVYQFPHALSFILSKSSTMQALVFGNLQGKYTFGQLGLRFIMNFPRILIQVVSTPMRFSHPSETQIDTSI